MSLSKYLNEADVNKLIGSLSIDSSFQPMSQDSYNEKAVLKTLLQTKRVPELLYAAINLACIGFGAKRFGHYKLNDIIVDILELMLACGVKTGLSRDAKLDEGDLTPGRLCRAFRYNIRAYLKVNGMETYIYKKYSDKNPKFLSVLFRGAEYLDDLDNDECEAIMIAHERLDQKHQTNISERIRRVFEAKGNLKKVIA